MSPIVEFLLKNQRELNSCETGQVAFKNGPAAALPTGGIIEVDDARVSVWSVKTTV